MAVNGEAETHSNALSWMALGVVYVVWGSTYLAIRVGVRDLPPLVLASVRYLVAGAILYPIAVRAKAKDRGSHKVGPRLGARGWFACAVVGILMLVIGNGGLSVAEKTLPSGFAAVLVATVPLWMLVFAWPIQRQRIAWRSATGLAVGLGGVAVLVSNTMGSGRAWSVILVLGASAAWRLGSALGHRLDLPTHALYAAAIEMLIGGGVLLVATAGTGELSHVEWSSVPTTSWIALAYLIGPGSILAFTAYGYALSHLPVTTVSTYAFVNPVVAVLAGTLILGEQLSGREGLGAVLVVASIVIILHRSRSAVVAGSERPAGATANDAVRPGPTQPPTRLVAATTHRPRDGAQHRRLLGADAK